MFSEITCLPIKIFIRGILCLLIITLDWGEFYAGDDIEIYQQ